MKKILLVLLLSTQTAIFAAETQSEKFFYVGFMGGYADVDWAPLVATDRSTLPTDPTSAKGTGGLFGVDIGYQFTPYVQLEAEYMRLPTSTIEYSAAAYRNYGTLSSSATTDLFCLIVKFIVPLGESGFSLFTDTGPAYEKRTDNVVEVSTYEPTFGAGVLYRVSSHVQIESSFQYVPGTGVSEKDPMDDYVPIVYAYTVKINYLF